MSERDNVLGRIREALRTKAPTPGEHSPGFAKSPPAPGAPPAARQWLPKVGETFDEQLVAFRKNALDLKADFHLLESMAELAGLLLALRDAESWKSVGVHRGELTDFATAKLGLPCCFTDSGYQVGELEGCSIGLTECDALVAQTGSVLLTARSAGGRALSVLPPHHVVLARRVQLVQDLPAAFVLLKEKYRKDYPSFISFITGPSRTGDIERILVLGAHGPRKLTICCV